MKKTIFFIAIFLLIIKLISAQQVYIDSLKKELAGAPNDTFKLLLVQRLATTYAEINPDSAYYYADWMNILSKKLNLQLEEALGLGESGYALLNLGNYPRSLQSLLAAISIVENPVSEENILPPNYPASDDFTDRSVSPRMQRLATWSKILQYTGILYGNSENYQKALSYYSSAIDLAQQSKNPRVLCITYLTQGRTYLALTRQDSALASLRKAYSIALSVNFKRYLGSILLNLGRVYQHMGDKRTATKYFWKALEESRQQDYFRGIVASHLVLAEIYRDEARPDSALHHIEHALQMANQLNAPALLLRAYTALADFYTRAGNTDSTVKYQSLIIEMNNRLFNSKQVQEFENIDFDAQQRQLAMQAAKEEYQDQLQKFLLLGGLAAFVLAAIFLWRSNRHRQRSNAILTRQNEEIETALSNLKTTQAQLIQAEKMASLGQLTTGIAHEIQNPVNFVNNFSEINTELLDELEQEIEKGNISSAREIAKDIRENEQKINSHGKRADAIVKNMLQHSLIGKGTMEPTDINKLADEHFQLAYRTWKTKDKSLQLMFITDFDDTIGKLNIIPQEIGRALLNLYLNALYAVTEKRNDLHALASPYEPTITVGTKKTGDQALITVTDNGTGINQQIADKIFQPFFTTKPTGQGTGLGLSLAYDIIKAHGGELKVKTMEKEGAEFTIRLPI